MDSVAKSVFLGSVTIGSSGRLCENSETFETVEKGYHIHDKISDLTYCAVYNLT